MRRAGSMLGERGSVLGRAVALVLRKAVLRVLCVQRYQQSVARDFGNNRGRGHAKNFRIRINDAGVGDG